MLLENKVVVVTGVGPGMGRKLALVAAREGAKVAVSARTAAYVEAVAEEIVASGGEAIAVATDVGIAEQCENLARETLRAFGRIDGLVNSARAHGPMRLFEEGTIEEWQANMDVTCFGALRMTYAVLPAMKEQGGGAIVNVSSQATVQPFTGEADYATAKAALNGATRQLANELGRYNIRVNAPRLGGMWGTPLETFFKERAVREGVPLEQIVYEHAAKFALGVIPPDEECAKSVLFFVSDYSTMVTGTSLDINGGKYMAP